mmetsp:Transcript_72978/g.122919  ORF Transcript_72978/g.122919 Transcript_72978/m.122919 type:complete len:213 (+) Transcript_72978:893-1531(+)
MHRMFARWSHLLIHNTRDGHDDQILWRCDAALPALDGQVMHRQVVRKASGINAQVKVHEALRHRGLHFGLPEVAGDGLRRHQLPESVPNGGIADDVLGAHHPPTLTKLDPHGPPVLDHHLVHVLPQVHLPSQFAEAPHKRIHNGPSSVDGVVNGALVPLEMHHRHLRRDGLRRQRPAQHVGLQIQEPLEELVRHVPVQDVAVRPLDLAGHQP